MPHRSRSALRVQAQALVILGTTLSLPGASLPARMGRQPTPSDTSVAGIPATVVRPTTSPPWPALVFMNGATPDGRNHATVRRLGVALARAGVVVFIPELPGVAGGELSPQTLAHSVAVAEAAAGSADTVDGRVALAGVSIGGTLALLSAADRRLQSRISVVACVAPFGDLAEVMRLATTGTHRNGEQLGHHAAPPYLRVGLARSLAAMLAVNPATTALCRELRALDPDSCGAIELPERAFREAGADGGRLYDLLANTDPDRFDRLFEALPDHVRSAAVSLSPIHVAHRLHAPVEIATAPQDRYFPIAEAQAIAAASPHVRLTVTSLLAHATPRLSARYLAELQGLNTFFVRALTAATSGRPLQSLLEQT
ncbi:MAG TPA: CocE/NonD family hydrolase [Gaiellaceae bacterium]|nr:CocE/NonD family hydrolase [Gaiellaceae bacterium]